MAAFGEKLGKILALLPTMYLSGGTCVTLIIIGDSVEVVLKKRKPLKSNIYFGWEEVESYK
ncbi:hypothetical protein P3S67_011313 [Capsicum chacoense]